MEFLVGVVILVLDIWAILKIFNSSASGLSKFLWAVLIVVLPVLGLIIWFLMGPKK